MAHHAALLGDADLLKKQVEAGVLVHAGYSDVKRIIEAIRSSLQARGL
ncbi:Uncharacterised protein [Starkeya nomas]|uniref:Uncharacterized protein n=1 Tax=Starkeya nomas TaxID=2666134 RepID=A0A5S9NJL2_9HYPH|nr:hypothetical protein [Starkeya nomas]CAA0090822.1 Uncharacterised protein [Starkeya nomas]